MTKRRNIILAVAAVLLVAVLILGLFFANKYSSQKPFRTAKGLASVAFADVPNLPGTIIWSAATDGGFEPSGFSFESHGGIITHTVTKVATADKATADKEYAALKAYMLRDKRMRVTEPVPGVQALSLPKVENNYALSGEVFVVHNTSELKYLSILLNDKPELDNKLQQHFAESTAPVYGYSITGSYSYK